MRYELMFFDILHYCESKNEAACCKSPTCEPGECHGKDNSDVDHSHAEPLPVLFSFWPPHRLAVLAQSRVAITTRMSLVRIGSLSTLCVCVCVCVWEGHSLEALTRTTGNL